MIKKFVRNLLIPKIYKFYLSTKLNPKEFNIKKEDKCLLLAPHSDDESIGAGGLLALYGEQFNVICLTNGYRGVKALPKEEAIVVRKQELTNAMEHANVKTFDTLNIDDKELVCDYETFSEIDVENYDYIFIPNIIDQHVDHKAVSINLARLLKEKKYKSDLKIVFYEVWAALPLPNAYVDISSVIDVKRNLINQHKSQVAALDYAKRISGLNSYRGMTAGNAEYAEAFLMVDVPTFYKITKSCV